MILKVFTVFDKLDGAGSQLHLHRSEKKYLYELQNSLVARNKELASKHAPTIDVNNLEIRCIGEYDDEVTKFTSYEIPYVIPWNFSNSDLTLTDDTDKVNVKKS